MPKAPASGSWIEIGPLTSEQRHERDLASHVHEQDLHKHVATLSTGAVLLLATFLERLSAQPIWKPVAAVSIVGFGAALVGTVLMQLFSVLSVSQELTDTYSGLGAAAFAVLIVLSFGGFLTGAVALVAFAVRNL